MQFFSSLTSLRCTVLPSFLPFPSFLFSSFYPFFFTSIFPFPFSFSRFPSARVYALARCSQTRQRSRIGFPFCTISVEISLTLFPEERNCSVLNFILSFRRSTKRKESVIANLSLCFLLMRKGKFHSCTTQEVFLYFNLRQSRRQKVLNRIAVGVLRI